MIVVFGSINVDLVARVAALPRPGETVLAPTYVTLPGGKGANQAVAAARAGAATRMVGCVGRDGFAELALGTLRAAGVDLGAVTTVEEPTGCAMIAVDGTGRNQITVASGANRAVRAAQLEAVPWGPRSTLLLQLEVDLDDTWAAARLARTRGARVVLNSAPAASVPAAVGRALDVVVMNEVEAPALAREAGHPTDDPVVAAERLARAWAVTAVVTLGAAGAYAFEPDAAWRIGALPLVVVDTTAAGDAFVGTFAAALDAGADLPEALRRASVAGGLACLSAGAQPSLPETEAIDAALPELAPARRL